MAKQIEACFSRNSDEWETPQQFYDELNAEFHFNLDPCATKLNHKCDKFFTAENDGIAQNWGGTGFFVIHHTAGFLNGSKSVIQRELKKTRWLLY